MRGAAPADRKSRAPWCREVGNSETISEQQDSYLCPLRFLKARLLLKIQDHLGLNEPNILSPHQVGVLSKTIPYFFILCILVLGSPGYHVLLEQN